MSPIISSLSTVRSSYGFGRRIVISTIGGGVTSDSYFSDVSLLLYGDGSNGSTAIVDSSSNNHAISVNGDAQISTTQSKFGGSSLYFDGTGDYLASPVSDTLSLGTSDFTIECWAWRSASAPANSVLMQMSNSADVYSALFGFAASSNFVVYLSSAGSSWDIASGQVLGSIDNETWVHYALTREGSTFRTFKNGVQQSTWTSSASIYQAANQVRIGRGQSSASCHYGGYIDDLRITKGVARYTSNFTPPTASFSTVAPGEKYFYQNSLLLYGDGTNSSTAIVDSSANAHTITVNGDAQISTTQSKFGGSSMYFDGSGDYLSIADDDAFDFGSGDFTMEAWIYMTSQGTFNYLVGQYGSSASVSRTFWSIANGYNDCYFYGSSTVRLTGTTSIPLNTWTHVAVSREGNTVRLFTNGQVDASGSFTVTLNNSTLDFTVGADSTAAYDFSGYIDDIRVTKGVARYTSNFTPPTAGFSTLTPVEPYFHNNSLLLHGDGTNGSTTFTDSSINNFTVTSYGNAQISTTQSKFGGASMYFDSVDDRLTLPSDSKFAFGTGDFTIEMWKYSEDISGSTQRGLLQISSTTGGLETGLAGTAGVAIWYGSAGVFRVDAGGVTVTCSISLLQNTWYHVAYTRSGNVHRLFIDGTERGSTTATAGNITAQNLVVGGVYSTSFLYKGYLDDLRITKGVARHTANFTPPTSAFPDL